MNQCCLEVSTRPPSPPTRSAASQPSCRSVQWHLHLAWSARPTPWWRWAFDGLNQPTSLEFIKNTAYVVTLRAAPAPTPDGQV